MVEFLEVCIRERNLIYGVVSKKAKKTFPEFNKISFKPFEKGSDYFIQLEYVYDKKVIHENLSADLAIDKLNEFLELDFRQVNVFAKDADYQALISKKGKVKVSKKVPSRKLENLSHNKEKNYLIRDGEKCDFLIELEVMTSEGKVKPSRYNKFRQINRFLELVEDVVSNLDSNEKVKIIDFGCGKSYLTFALYYYLVNLKSYEVDIIGLDLKEDVIDFCNDVAQKLNYEGLLFKYGNIKDYEMKGSVDLIITLHACDTATDAALIKGITWDVKNILSVPCCQHEFFPQIKQEKLNPLLKHGILKERVSALMTDSLRGMYLEAFGYEVNIMEFIDLEHTPKNILIKAKKVGKFDKAIYNSCLEYKSYFNIEQSFLAEGLKNLIDEKQS